MSNSRRRVVITGLGIVSPLGTGVQTNWDAVSKGESGAGPITQFDPARLPTKIAGEVKGFEAEKYLSRQEIRRYDPYAHYGIAAAQMAIQDSGLPINEQNGDRVGVLIGSGIGGLSSIANGQKTLEHKTPNRLSPFFILMAIGNTASGVVSIRYGAKGPNMCIVSACATGSHSIGEAFRYIQYGTADAMIAGGADADICEIGVGSFCVMKALTTRNDEPKKASRPFDKGRDGFLIAEGAGVVILEELEAAKKRGAKIYAEIVGYGLNSDAYHLTTPTQDGGGPAKCMSLAIQDAGISPEEIGYINAHGTSTGLGDIAETRAIKTLFKDYAKKVSVSSTKSMTGHMLGAAGGAETIYTILALKNGLIPPTINLDDPDPECDLDYTPNTAKEKKFDLALSNSFGFGSTNACLVFRRFE